MANKTILDLDLAASVAGTESVELSTGERATLSQIAALGGGGGGATDFTDLGDVPASYTGQQGKVARVNSAQTALEFAYIPAELGVACSDESTVLTTGLAKITFRMPYAMTLTAVRASLGVAQTSGSIFTVDINDSGTTILSTKLTIDNTEKTSTTAATAAVISNTTLADDAEITVDIDQLGDGTAKGLKIWLIGHRTP